MTGALLQFALCALLIARAGWTLSHSADRLAALHGWGRGWAGLALLGTVTSLPELASGMTRSQVAARLPDLLARLNPAGGHAAPVPGSETPVVWKTAIETALSPSNGTLPLRHS